MDFIICVVVGLVFGANLGFMFAACYRIAAYHANIAEMLKELKLYREGIKP